MPEVDEVWHLALLNTREYQQVCNQCFGAMIHHSTRSATDPEPEKKRRRLHALQTIQSSMAANMPGHLAKDVPLDIEISFPFDGVENTRASRTWSAPVRWPTIQSEAEQFVKNTAASYLGVFPHEVEVVFGSDAKLLLYGDTHLIKAWRSKAPAGMVRIRYQVLDGDRVVPSSGVFNFPLTMKTVREHASELLAVPADRVHLAPSASEDTPVVDLSVFRAWPKRDDEIRMYVKTLTGKTIPLLVEGEDTILKVKQLIRLREDLDDIEHIRLIFAGKYLEDGETVGSCGIGAESTVHWLPKLRGC